MITKLLIANRGEIACRIIRTAQRMGIATVAVYSDADEGALHARMADRAMRVGGSPAPESYLNIDAIIDAARETGADAIHPGYGFLSENADFAQRCRSSGFVFIGPPVEAIRAMGDKANAKSLMRQAGVPVVPGYDGDDQSPTRFALEAERIGFPVLVKAAAGGGGRGMRRVETSGGLAGALESARREAEGAFGDGTLLLERLVENARHIEVQVFGDQYGNVVHLGERDCSTQRRHQKVIEEAPSPLADGAMRAGLAEAAVAAARAVDYVGAGTVEFIVDSERAFFFLEMNTRLQVEHPVTELVTGLDLVELQLRVAGGEALPFSQDDIAWSGHAIEARLCAEDPAAGFAPQTGRVLHWKPERVQVDGVRIDHGLVEGGEVSPFYDPMIAKVIAHGATREEAILKLKRALATTPLLGVQTNRAFLLDLLAGDAFRSGAMTTGLLDTKPVEPRQPAASDFALAAAVLAFADGDDWFSSTGKARCPVTLECGGVLKVCTVLFERGGLKGVEVDGAFHGVAKHSVDAAIRQRQGRELWLECGVDVLRFEEPAAVGGKRRGEDAGAVVSPVSGLLRHIAIDEGDSVRSGDVLAIVEAMKMETRLVAGRDGVAVKIWRRLGEQVRAGDILVEIVDDKGVEG